MLIKCLHGIHIIQHNIVPKCDFIAIFMNPFTLPLSKRKIDTESGANYVRMLFVKRTKSGSLGK